MSVRTDNPQIFLFRKQAKVMVLYFKSVHGIEIKHGHALECIARMNDFKNWNTCIGMINRKAGQ